MRLLVVGASALAAGCGGTTGVGGDGGAVDGGSSDDAFGLPDATPVPAFAVQFVDPDHGSFRGGTEVTVRGNGFSPDDTVFVGGRMVDPIYQEFVDSRRFTIFTPPGEPGLADVEVRRPGLTATLANAYTYEAIHLEPASGSVAGGTFVTITGLGTDFGPDTVVLFDGLPMLDVQIINEQVLTGSTPPGVAGNADVRVIGNASLYEADRAFTYFATGDPFAGGMSGGPINGTLNVVVIEQGVGDGVPQAFVSIGDPATSTLKGFTDNLGQITFSQPGLSGPLDVHAAAPGYEITSFLCFDAENITIFLRRPPQPATGPIPPGPQVGIIRGHIAFGNTTGIGSPYWTLVPEPRTPTEVKRVYVTTSSPHLYASSYPPNAPIDYTFDPSVSAWEFQITARPSALAVVAIAGLYDPAKDPEGLGTSGFEPFAMGVARGVLVGAGEIVTGVDVVIDIPLDGTMAVNLNAPPALKTPGWTGPDYITLRPFVDLGGEGPIAMNKNGLRTPAPPAPRPNVYDFPDGMNQLVLGGFAPLVGLLADASYAAIVGAYAAGDSNPFSVRVVRGISTISEQVTVGEFVGVPRPVDPPPGMMAANRAVSFIAEAPANGAATFHAHYLQSATSEPLWRVFTCPENFDFDFPDLSEGGASGLPGDTDLVWTIWRIRVDGTTYNQFNHRLLSVLYQSAYAADAFIVQFPSP